MEDHKEKTQQSFASLVRKDPWQELQSHTSARIALGRVGTSLPTAEVLRFGLAHAQARDAVHHPLDVDALQNGLGAAGFSSIRVNSKADNRHTYLLRPDLGRRLDDASAGRLEQATQHVELAVVIADGLSSIAIMRHAVPLLTQLRDAYVTDWHHTPVIIASQGRVAIGDEIGAALKARLVVVLIGERPGLTAPDSLGIYLTYEPRIGRMDSERNCISNIRPEGLRYEVAVHKLASLMKQSLHLRLSGIGLKDESVSLPASDAGKTSAER
ncbi:ethanolamine ammonia-lyase subunit EutC [Herbaspirillum sp. GCM10030257]|uniref:ethanolamine ammonia-lyase subunit EutC n=1 Tax=Herbaspirillum sp. GCM10030257 TaxID=3273393 RepID=UPI0036083557